MKPPVTKRLVHASHEGSKRSLGMPHSLPSKSSTASSTLLPTVNCSLSSSGNLLGGPCSQRWATECGFQQQDFASPWNDDWAPPPSVPAEDAAKELELERQSFRKRGHSNSEHFTPPQSKIPLPTSRNSLSFLQSKECSQEGRRLNKEGHAFDTHLSSVSIASELTDVFLSYAPAKPVPLATRQSELLLTSRRTKEGGETRRSKQLRGPSAALTRLHSEVPRNGRVRRTTGNGKSSKRSSSIGVPLEMQKSSSGEASKVPREVQFRPGSARLKGAAGEGEAGLKNLTLKMEDSLLSRDGPQFTPPCSSDGQDPLISSLEQIHNVLAGAEQALDSLQWPPLPSCIPPPPSSSAFYAKLPCSDGSGDPDFASASASLSVQPPLLCTLDPGDPVYGRRSGTRRSHSRGGSCGKKLFVSSRKQAASASSARSAVASVRKRETGSSLAQTEGGLCMESKSVGSRRRLYTPEATEEAVRAVAEAGLAVLGGDRRSQTPRPCWTQSRVLSPAQGQTKNASEGFSRRSGLRKPDVAVSNRSTQAAIKNHPGAFNTASSVARTEVPLHRAGRANNIFNSPCRQHSAALRTGSAPPPERRFFNSQFDASLAEAEAVSEPLQVLEASFHRPPYLSRLRQCVASLQQQAAGNPFQSNALAPGFLENQTLGSRQLPSSSLVEGNAAFAPLNRKTQIVQTQLAGESWSDREESTGGLVSAPNSRGGLWSSPTIPSDQPSLHSQAVQTLLAKELPESICSRGLTCPSTLPTHSQWPVCVNESERKVRSSRSRRDHQRELCTSVSPPASATDCRDGTSWASTLAKRQGASRGPAPSSSTRPVSAEDGHCRSRNSRRCPACSPEAQLEKRRLWSEARCNNPTSATNFAESSWRKSRAVAGSRVESCNECKRCSSKVSSQLQAAQQTLPAIPLLSSRDLELEARTSPVLSLTPSSARNAILPSFPQSLNCRRPLGISSKRERQIVVLALSPRYAAAKGSAQVRRSNFCPSGLDPTVMSDDPHCQCFSHALPFKAKEKKARCGERSLADERKPLPSCALHMAKGGGTRLPLREDFPRSLRCFPLDLEKPPHCHCLHCCCRCPGPDAACTRRGETRKWNIAAEVSDVSSLPMEEVSFARDANREEAAKHAAILNLLQRRRDWRNHEGRLALTDRPAAPVTSARSSGERSRLAVNSSSRGRNYCSGANTTSDRAPCTNLKEDRRSVALQTALLSKPDGSKPLKRRFSSPPVFTRHSSASSFDCVFKDVTHCTQLGELAAADFEFSKLRTQTQPPSTASRHASQPQPRSFTRAERNFDANFNSAVADFVDEEEEEVAASAQLKARSSQQGAAVSRVSEKVQVRDGNIERENVETQSSRYTGSVVEELATSEIPAASREPPSENSMQQHHEGPQEDQLSFKTSTRPSLPLTEQAPLAGSVRSSTTKDVLPLPEETVVRLDGESKSRVVAAREESSSLVRETVNAGFSKSRLSSLERKSNQPECERQFLPVRTQSLVAQKEVTSSEKPATVLVPSACRKGSDGLRRRCEGSSAEASSFATIIIQSRRGRARLKSHFNNAHSSAGECFKVVVGRNRSAAFPSVEQPFIKDMATAPINVVTPEGSIIPLGTSSSPRPSPRGSTETILLQRTSPAPLASEKKQHSSLSSLGSASPASSRSLALASTPEETSAERLQRSFEGNSFLRESEVPVELRSAPASLPSESASSFAPLRPLRGTAHPSIETSTKQVKEGISSSVGVASDAVSLNAKGRDSVVQSTDQRTLQPPRIIQLPRVRLLGSQSQGSTPLCRRRVSETASDVRLPPPPHQVSPPEEGETETVVFSLKGEHSYADSSCSSSPSALFRPPGEKIKRSSHRQATASSPPPPPPPRRTDAQTATSDVGCTDTSLRDQARVQRIAAGRAEGEVSRIESPSRGPVNDVADVSVSKSQRKEEVKQLLRTLHLTDIARIVDGSPNSRSRSSSSSGGWTGSVSSGEVVETPTTHRRFLCVQSQLPPSPGAASLANATQTMVAVSSLQLPPLK